MSGPRHHRHGVACIVDGRLACGYGSLHSSAVSPFLIAAAEELTEELRRARIPHAVVGGLAANAYGYERATTDIDLLLRRDDARLRGVLGHISPQPVGKRDGGFASFKGLDVDLLYLDPSEKRLATELHAARLPIISPGGLFYLKLLSSRAKDWADVIELLKVDPSLARKATAFLREQRPALLTKLADAVATAERERNE